MSSKHGSPGAGYDPNKDHFHAGLHDDEIRDQLSSPVHGCRGIEDESGEDRNRNNYFLKDRERPGGGHDIDSPDADKKHRPRVTKDDGDRGEQKAGEV